MDGEIGSNPSYVWRSLLVARDVIKEGSKWTVGDGRYIEVSNHIWLTHKPIFLGEARPNELIDNGTGQWEREKVFDLFAHRTRMEILQMPLSRLSSRDVLLGQFGMLEINFILSISKPIQWLFLMKQLVFCNSIKGW